MAKDDKNTKTLVIDTRSGARIPYLRGIMARSLQDAGLNFNEAYKLATWLRRELAGVDELTTEALRERVVARLGERHGEAVRTRYLQRNEVPVTVQVRTRSGSLSPFAPAMLARALESASLNVEQAGVVVQRLFTRLQQMEIQEIHSSQLARLVHEDLLEHFGAEMAHRYLVWLDFWRSGRPLILLVGGVNGVGKSTIASDLAHRLDIVRTQSTDMLREVMRKMTPKRLLPSVHTSSFTAWNALPAGYVGFGDSESLVVDGYLTQAEQVAVAIDAVLGRALGEQVAMIIEGIHLHPAYMQATVRNNKAIIVPFMLAVLDPETMRQQLRGRVSQAPSRRAERYLDNLDTIWKLQGFLLAEADRCHIPIIANWPTVPAVEQAMDMIHTVLARRFDADPERLLAIEEPVGGADTEVPAEVAKEGGPSA